jgi:prophage regulatory protein
MKRLLRLPEVVKLVGLSKSTVYNYIKENKFPPSYPISTRCRGWDSSAVNQWIQDRINGVPLRTLPTNQGNPPNPVTSVDVPGGIRRDYKRP